MYISFMKSMRSSPIVILSASLLLGAMDAMSRDADADTVELRGLEAKARKRPAFSKSSFQEMRDRSSSVLEFTRKSRNRDPNVSANFIGEGVIPGAVIWMYPSGSGFPLPSMTDKQAKDGRFAFEVVLKADVYSGMGLCSPTPLNLTPYLKTGMLEVWVKGAVGKEVFSLGLLDNGSNGSGRPLQTWINSRSHAKVLPDQWKKIQVPLRAFGKRGSFWSEEANARISNTFNWSGVSCLTVDIDKARQKSFRIWLDDAVIYKKTPGIAPVSGDGYPLSNEPFDDFPVSGR